MSQKREQEFKISDITDKIPFTCRFITASVFFIWLADIFIHIISYLANDANLTWTPSYQIWRLFTASFCISSLLTLFIAGINCYTFLPKLVILIWFRNFESVVSIYFCNFLWLVLLFRSYIQFYIYFYQRVYKIWLL